jgi:hypothetical protein
MHLRIEITFFFPIHPVCPLRAYPPPSPGSSPLCGVWLYVLTSPSLAKLGPAWYTTICSTGGGVVEAVG